MGLVGATSLVVGSVIGSGIFLTPAIVARHLPSPTFLLLAWVVGGLLSLGAALTFAELAGMYPHAGGQYVFLREAYGRGAGFVFGWMALVVNYSGTIAAVAVAFSFYLGTLFGYGGLGVKFAAVGLIWFLTLVNIVGLRQASAVQVASTVAKLGALAALLVFGLALGHGPDPGYGDAAPGLAGGGRLVAAFGLAVVAALFAYDGLASATFVGEEIKDPSRTIPRATVLGAFTIIGVYLAANVAFLNVLPIDRLAGNDRAVFDIGEALGGRFGGQLMAVAVVVATFGTVNGYVLQSPRIYYAMARDRLLYASFGRLDARRQTPVFGLILQAEWTSLLVLSGTFEQLITYVVMSSWVFYGLTGLALFRLRRTRPDAPRPHRVWGYPVVPALFIAAAVLIVANSLLFDTRNALIGVVLSLSGIPIYFFVRRAAEAPPKTVS
jgi:amino acid transporter